MATITLKYDARNSIAKKAIELLLSLGVFSINDKDTETTEEKKFRKELEHSLKQSLEISKRVKRTGSTKGLKSLETII